MLVNYLSEASAENMQINVNINCYIAKLLIKNNRVWCYANNKIQ